MQKTSANWNSNRNVPTRSWFRPFALKHKELRLLCRYKVINHRNNDEKVSASLVF